MWVLSLMLVISTNDIEIKPLLSYPNNPWGVAQCRIDKDNFEQKYQFYCSQEKSI